MAKNNSPQVRAGLRILRKRHNLHIVKISGEIASADHKAVKEFPNLFMQLIKEKCLMPMKPDPSGRECLPGLLSPSLREILRDLRLAKTASRFFYAPMQQAISK